MEPLQLNLGVVFGAGAFKFVLGWLWFSPALFLKSWMKSVGLKESQMNQGMVKSILTHLIGNLLMAFVLAHAIKYAQMGHGMPTGAVGGLLGGFVNWLGFVAVAHMDLVTAEKRSFNPWFTIVSGYQLVGLCGMGAILSMWA